MQLRVRTLHELAEAVCGGSGSGMFGSARPAGSEFPYRSSSALTDFFRTCDTEHVHDGSSRVSWAQSVLEELNKGPCARLELPADLIVRVIQELMDPYDYERQEKDRTNALEKLNASLTRESLQAYLDENGKCHLRAANTTSATVDIARRAFSQKEREAYSKWTVYLDSASEDDFTENVLVPILQSCGFQRVSVAGHKDKALEYGKDLWMKHRLPTGHWIYFGVQVKKGKLDSAAKSKGDNDNISEVLNQVKKALDTEIWDPDFNKKVLIDHVYIVASGDITKAARNLLGEKLDRESRRHILFMDREDILTLAVQTGLELPASPDADPFF